ncbi:unnamed protein product [Euphydryas editha]|uniref:Uncharacterized protein n=1 Tax=Euphydryas editha TaxID=104508 RepID=A0AAU9U7G9_EUPED|nr:unnamed protein product [Euphydryas editha]
MRSRRKILLIHGIPETKNENLTSVVIKVLTDHLKVPELSCTAVSRSHRMGRTKFSRPRPIVIKFHDVALRNKIWYEKTNLKNTGITLTLRNLDKKSSRDIYDCKAAFWSLEMLDKGSPDHHYRSRWGSASHYLYIRDRGYNKSI